MSKFIGGEKVRILSSDKHDDFLGAAVGRMGIVDSAYYESIDNTVSVVLEGAPIDDSHTWYFDVDGLEIIEQSYIPDPTPEAPVRPSHYYTAGMPEGVAVIDVIQAQGADFLHGNIIKYILRWKWKNGVEDLKKARTYLGWLIAQEEAKNTQPVHIPYLDN